MVLLHASKVKLYLYSSIETINYVDKAVLLMRRLNIAGKVGSVLSRMNKLGEKADRLRHGVKEHGK